METNYAPYCPVFSKSRHFLSNPMKSTECNQIPAVTISYTHNLHQEVSHITIPKCCIEAWSDSKRGQTVYLPSSFRL